MLDHPTLDQLKTLRRDGMAEAFSEMQSQDGTANLTYVEWLGLLIDTESIAVRPNVLTAACALQNCAMSARRRKTWITKPGAASTKPGSSKC